MAASSTNKISAPPQLHPLAPARTFACWSGSHRRLAGELALITIPLLAYLLHTLLFRHWIIDDAGISFVYARNLATGHGLVTQPGAPHVEGFSNPLWVALHLFDPLLTPKLISFCLVAAAFLFFARAFRPAPLARCGWMIFFALLLIAGNASFVIWTCSGLENALYTCLAAALFQLCARFTSIPSQRRSAALAGLLAAALALSRPDGLTYIIVFPLVLAFTLLIPKTRTPKRFFRLLVHYAIWFIAPYGAYLLFRHAYFHDLFPNTYYVKININNFDLWGLLRLNPEAIAKMRILMQSIGPDSHRLTSVLLLTIASIWIFKRRIYGPEYHTLLLLLAPAAFSYLLLPFDWMPHYRFATLFIFFACAFIVQTIFGVITALNFRSGSLTHSLKAAAGLLMLAETLNLSLPISREFAQSPTVSFATVWAAFQPLENYAIKLNRPNISILYPDMGGTLYYSKFRLYDLGGLCDRTIARTLRTNPKAFHNYIFDRIKPSIIAVHNPWDIYAALDTDARFRRDYVPIAEGTDTQATSDTRHPVKWGNYIRRELKPIPPTP